MNSPEARPTPAAMMPGPIIRPGTAAASGRSRTCGRSRCEDGNASAAVRSPAGWVVAMAGPQVVRGRVIVDLSALPRPGTIHPFRLRLQHGDAGRVARLPHRGQRARAVVEARAAGSPAGPARSRPAATMREHRRVVVRRPCRGCRGSPARSAMTRAIGIAGCAQLRRQQPDLHVPPAAAQAAHRAPQRRGGCPARPATACAPPPVTPRTARAASVGRGVDAARRAEPAGPAPAPPA